LQMFGHLLSFGVYDNKQILNLTSKTYLICDFD